MASRDAELPAESGAAQSAATESIVVVSDDRCTGAAGCDAVSVFGLPSLDLVFRGPHLYCSPGRLAADRALSVVVAQPSNGNSSKLLVTRRAGPLAQDWAAELVAAPSGLLVLGGVALKPDGADLLVAVSVSARPPQQVSFWPPYAVYKYRMAEIAGAQLGPDRGRLSTDSGMPFEILVAADGSLAHILTNTGELRTVAVDTMAEVAAPVAFGRLPRMLNRLGSLHASLSADERVVATNLPEGGRVAFVDVVARTSWTAALPPGPPSDGVGGVAFN